MPNLQQGLRLLLPIVAKKRKHAHYDHVCKLAKEYYRPLVTGEGANHLIQRFNLREDDEAYRQRLRLTQLITPAITNTLMAPARKIPRVRPVVDSVVWKSEDGKAARAESEKREQDLDKAVSKFYGGKSVDHFIGSVLLDQGAIDPNAFCLVLFGDFDNRREKPKPYPSIIGCEDAWNFEYLNGELNWLVVHRDYDYEATTLAKSRVSGGRIEAEALKEPKKVKGHAWWMYTEQHQVMMLQVDKARVANALEGVVFDGAGKAVDGTGAVQYQARSKYWFRASKEELYEVVFYEHKSGQAQAFRLGFVPDHRTKGATMLSLWNAAMPYLLKGIKAGSELDLSAALHAFLQKISYENPCNGWMDPVNKAPVECNMGRAPDGTMCKGCGGSGMQVHRSGQDHITLAMPKAKEDAFDLASLTHYVQLPVEVLEWQDKYVDKLERACYRSVYNSDRFRPADASTTTATGDIIDLQSIYDTLKPCADWYSQSRVLIYRLIASAVVGSESNAQLEVAHEFPRNMRFETTSERVKLLGELRTSGASNGAMLQVDGAILDDLYVDDPEALKKAKTMSHFNPFVGKSEATVMALISQDLATKEDKVLWANENRVYFECEESQKDKEVGFYDLPRFKQRAIIDTVVQGIIDELAEQEEAAAEKMTLGVAQDDEEEEDEPAGGNDPTGKDVPPSPGAKATE